MSTPEPGPRSWWHIYRWPLALGALTLVGLLAALLGDGVWNVVSWLALGVVTAVLLLPLRTAR
jgi:hypothetical protein